MEILLKSILRCCARYFKKQRRNILVLSVKSPEKGKLSKTQYEVLSESTKYSLVKINLLTGRKNQIRVQFAEEGYPVVGDRTYGVKETGIKRLALHATSLSFNHPVTDERMNIKTEIPEYFNFLISG